MIKTIKKWTKVEFAKNQIGVISISNKVEEGRNLLTLQQMKPEIGKKVGQEVNIKNEVVNLPKVELEFHNVSSIDTLIKQLELLRNSMLYPYGPPYYLAC